MSYLWSVVGPFFCAGLGEPSQCRGEEPEGRQEGRCRQADAPHEAPRQCPR